jgi:hypothetical protein
MPIVTTEPLPVVFNLGVVILIPDEYSASVLYSLTVNSAGDAS